MTLFEQDLKIYEEIETIIRRSTSTFLFPGIVQKKLSVDIELRELYRILDYFVDEHILNHYFEIKCPKCKDCNGTFIKSLNELPKTAKCKYCGETIKVTLENVIAIYRIRRTK